jgi:hypothetical protein
MGGLIDRRPGSRGAVITTIEVLVWCGRGSRADSEDAATAEQAILPDGSFLAFCQEFCQGGPPRNPFHGRIRNTPLRGWAAVSERPSCRCARCGGGLLLLQPAADQYAHARSSAAMAWRSMAVLYGLVLNSRVLASSTSKAA